MRINDLHIEIVLFFGLLLLSSATRAVAADPRMAAPEKNPVTGNLARVPPTPANEAAKTFQVLDEFKMDLLAAEPLVASPVAMTYDENGRAYVCEMRDYPYTDKALHKSGQENPNDQPIGRVRLLEDIDGDGVFDKATVFAEELSWPTGVACWKGGVFVAATPDIWYLKDKDGDGKADERRKVFTGFRKYNVQAVMNNLVWGLDNFIHGAGGSNGGRVRPIDKADAKPLTLARNDFRINPLTGEMDLLSGGARFGGTFDDWGHRFLCNIRNPAQHAVLPDHYLVRNRFLAAPSPLADMAESGDQLPVYPISRPELWRTLRANRWAADRDINMPRSELVGSGVVTSASGITCYRGAAYPEKYRGNIFIAECAGNLFYRLNLTPDGVTFKAARVDGKVEMVASTDNWFRPVNFVNAPDGTLHVIDMYREIIEHPWSIPDDIHAAIDLTAGRDRGRIWRLTPPDFKVTAPPRLGSASSAELVATLENPNSWWRETAQRLLFERQDKSVVPQLRDLVRNGQSPVARLHALWILHGMKELSEEDLIAALNDDEAGVRENGVRLAESHTKIAKIADAICSLAADNSATVRLQTAFSLGECDDPKALDALASLAVHDASDPWIRTAVLSSVADTAEPLLSRLLLNREFIGRSDSHELVRDLAHVIGVRANKREIQLVLKTIGKASAMRVISGLGQGLKRSGKSLHSLGLDAESSHIVNQCLNEAARLAADATASTDARRASIRLLAYDDLNRVKTLLSNLLVTSEPQEVQCEAVRTLGSFTSPEVAPLLLANWSGQTPPVRAEVVTAMLGVRNRALPLLRAIDSGLVSANQIPIHQRRALQHSRVAEVKRLATKLFSSSQPSPRNEVIKKYKRALSLRGDTNHGRVVFEKNCAICHRSGDIGTSDAGPNLANIRAWNSEQLLIHILDPNREVAPNFVAYTVVTKEGQVIYGLIAEDNVASLLMKRTDGNAETVLRADIDEITGSGLSLMPEGLENTISPQDMADLITFLLRSIEDPKR